MRNRLSPAVYSAAALAMAFLFYLSPDAVTDGVTGALHVCAERVIPSVFPFSVLSSFFIRTGGADRIDAALSRPFYCAFGLSRGASALFCGLSFGFPLGAMCIGSLYVSDKIDRREASRLLTFTACASPAYPVFAVGRGMFGSTSVGLTVFAASALASVFIGAVLALLRPLRYPYTPPTQASGREIRLADAVTSSVSDASRVMVTVCGAVVFFSTLGRTASEAILSLTDSPEPSIFISCVFEFASGCAASASAYASGAISLPPALFLCAFAVGFSGLSVICQTASVLPEGKINVVPFIFAKFATGLLSGISAYLIAPYLDADVNASVTYPIGSFSASSLIPSAVILLFFAVFSIKKRKSA